MAILGWVVRVEVVDEGLPPGRQERKDRDSRVVTVCLLPAAIYRQEGVAVEVRAQGAMRAAAAAKVARAPPTGSRDRRWSMQAEEEEAVDAQKPRPVWAESAGAGTGARTLPRVDKTASPTRVAEEGVVGHPTASVDPEESADRVL